MAGTVSSATSSLASELLLNKIMNGTAQTSTGASITAAGRAVSQRLSTEAYDLRTAVKNMDYGMGYAQAAQGEVSSLRDQLIKMRKELNDVYNNQAAKSDDFRNAQGKGMQLFAQFSAAVSGAMYNGVCLFHAGAGETLNAGNKLQFTLATANSATMKEGIQTALAAVTNRVKACQAMDTINKAITYMQKVENRFSGDVTALQNRQLILEDQASNLDNTAAAQSTMDLNGAGNLLNAMLGNSTI